MAKKTTNELIDIIAATIADFEFSDYGMDDVEHRIDTDRAGQEWIELLAREIARAVR